MTEVKLAIMGWTTESSIIIQNLDGKEAIYNGDLEDFVGLEEQMPLGYPREIRYDFDGIRRFLESKGFRNTKMIDAFLERERICQTGIAMQEWMGNKSVIISL